MDPSRLVAASQPEAVQKALEGRADELRTAGAHHHPAGPASVRRVSHAGHEIVIETSYTVTVDGEPFDAQLTVGNGGQVHYHGLPTRAFTSAIDLVKQAIDQFPDDFEPAGAGAGGGPGHHHGEEH